MLEKESEFEEKEKFDDIVQKYNIDVAKLEQEQEKLAKNIDLNDSMDFSLATRVAGIDNIFFRNNIISVIVVMENGEVVEQEYFKDKIKFPYLSGFRSYRELPAMVSVFNMLDEKPDIVFIRAHGILHPRRLGLTSHFSLVTGVPAIGIADRLLIGEQKGEDIILNGELAGKMIETKKGARPIYVSPGNKISVVSAAEMTRKFTKEPHKMPEPLRLAKKYAKEIFREIFKP